ncbi:hypothetical protein CO613_01015 [Lysobacteraceae bacterium NML07-0707]|nr:hypothetical protein CO613_01015 [Xanthomonadaceae bacterium NML07-0707]
MTESPKEVARRLAAPAIKDGFQLQALHEYRSADGVPVFWRIRCKHADGRKWIRPMKRNGGGFAIGEPPASEAGKLLYRLPELLAADPARPVWMVEGESCADALAKLAVTVTTTGAADSAGTADLSPLAGRHVIIWPDNDKPGGKYAEALRARLAAIGCTVEAVEVASLDLPDKGDCVDWLTANPDATSAEVEALPRAEMNAPEARLAGFAPEPLRRALPPGEPYPLDALGEVLGAAAKRLHEVIQCPAALAGQSILAAASLAVQALADVHIDGRREPLSLWLVTVGDSGERKTGVERYALQAHRAHERLQLEQYQADKKAFEIEERIYKGKVKEAEQKKAGNLREALMRLEDEPRAPLAPWLLLDEPTLEGLHKLFQIGKPSLGLFNDDAGDFLGGNAMNRDNRAKTAAGMSKLWDSGQFSRVRAGDGAAKFYGRRFALHVMVQPVIAEGVLSDDLLTGQGFLPRCLMAWPQSTVGTRLYVATDLTQDPALCRYWLRIDELLNLPLPVRDGSVNELEPRALTLEPEAKALWVEAHNAIEFAMRDEYAHVKAWASKGSHQALRIAGVLALVEKPGATTINRDTLNRALVLMDYYLTEAARIVGTASVPAKIRHAEALLGWCRETGRDLLYSTVAMNKGPSCIRTAAAFNEAMSVLEATGWAEYIEGGADVDGRNRARVWRMNLEAEQ